MSHFVPGPGLALIRVLLPCGWLQEALRPLPLTRRLHHFEDTKPNIALMFYATSNLSPFHPHLFKKKKHPDRRYLYRNDSN